MGKPQRTWVEPEQLPALIDAADEWFRPVVAVLVGAGLRNGEAGALDWRDINLATGTLTVRHSKTDAGSYRQVDIPRGLIDVLAVWQERCVQTGPDDPVLLARPRRREGESEPVPHRQTETNVAHRLKTTIKRANKRLAKVGIEPISERVSPHSLRRSYASVRAALRDDPVYIAEQGGWEDAGFVFRVYQKAVKRRDRLEGAYLEEFDRALEWARIGRVTDGFSQRAGSGANASPSEASSADPRQSQKPHGKAIIE